jgi:hypothetical protein
MSVKTTVGAAQWAKTIDDIKRNAFWIIGGLTVCLLSYIFYNTLNRPVAGALIFVGGALIMFYYWIRWFVVTPLPDDDFNPVQACPDYLSLIPPGDLYPADDSGRYFCVDFVGVSRNGHLKKIYADTLAQNILDPSYHFTIYPTEDFTTKGRSGLVNRLMHAGLSWNSIGANSAPSRSTSNGIPAPPSDLVGGASEFTLTPGVMEEVVFWGQAQNIKGDATPAQLQELASRLISKNLAPPGTTASQIKAAFESMGPNMDAPENQHLKDKAQSDYFTEESRKDPNGQLFVDSTTGLAIGFIQSNGNGGCYSSTNSETLMKCYEAMNVARDRLYSNEQR